MDHFPILIFVLVFEPSSEVTVFKRSCLDIRRPSVYKSGSCLVFYEGNDKTRSAASMTCSNNHKDGHLARIHNQQQINQLQAVFDLAIPGWCALVHGSNETDSWVQNEDSTFKLSNPPWASSVASNLTGDGVVVSKNGINNVNLTSLHPFLCQFAEPTAIPTEFKRRESGSVGTSDQALDEWTVVSMHVCAESCAPIEACQSFAYNSVSKECHLYSLPAHHLNLSVESGSRIFDKIHQDTDCTDEDDCIPNNSHMLVISGIGLSTVDAFYPLEPSRGGAVADLESIRSSASVVWYDDKILIAGGGDVGTIMEPKNAVTIEYLGCYQDSGSRYLKSETFEAFKPTPTKCAVVCYGLGFMYSGTEAGSICWCGTQAEFENPNYAKRPEGECSSACTGDSSKKCGGGWRNSIYKNTGDQITYEGCYQDDGNRHLYSEHIQNKLYKITPARCGIILCSAFGYIYSGTQSGWACFCGTPAEFENPAYLKIPDEHCSSNCEGDADLKCGAGYRNTMHKNTGFMKSVMHFDPDTNSYAYLPDMLTKRGGSGAATLHGSVILCGGYAGDTLIDLKSCEMFKNYQWHSMPSMNTKRHGLVMVNLNNKIFAMGGYAFVTGNVRSVERFDLTTNQWTILNDLRADHHEAGAAVFGGKIIICGGYLNYKGCDMYDEINDQWSAIADMNHQRRGLDLVVFNGLLYAVAGQNSNAGKKSTVEVYDSDTDTWEVSQAELTVDRSYMHVVVV